MLIDRLRVLGDSLNTAVESVVRAVERYLPISEEQRYRIRLVSKELLNNILSYSDADRIDMAADLDEDVLTITIDDNGSGFPYDELMTRDVTQSAYLHREGGRGIFLVRCVSDGFQYNAEGNSVEVTLKLK